MKPKYYIVSVYQKLKKRNESLKHDWMPNVALTATGKIIVLYRISGNKWNVDVNAFSYYLKIISLIEIQANFAFQSFLGQLIFIKIHKYT